MASVLCRDAKAQRFDALCFFDRIDRILRINKICFASLREKAITLFREGCKAFSLELLFGRYVGRCPTLVNVGLSAQRTIDSTAFFFCLPRRRGWHIM